MNLSDNDYRRLANLRHGQRRFLHWSAEQARDVGLTATQHQLLLGIRASEADNGPTVGEIAAFLLVKHHSAVELVDRAQRAGLVERRRDAEHQTLVHVTLTTLGEAKLQSLSEIHLQELVDLAPMMSALWSALADVAGTA